MAKTFTFAVSASPATTPIVVQRWTKKIFIQEDPSSPGYPSTDFLVRQPTASDPPVRILSGSAFEIETTTGPFGIGQIVGYVSGVSGSATFAQNEGFIIRIGKDAEPTSSTQQTYFQITWAEVNAF